jgi:hypothetical protein
VAKLHEGCLRVPVKHLDSLGMPPPQITQNIDQEITQNNFPNHTFR